MVVSASQIRTVKSRDAVTIVLPSGLKETFETRLLCFISEGRGSPEGTFHRRAQESWPAVTTTVESGLKAASTTQFSACRIGALKRLPVSASQIRAVESWLVVTTYF